MKPVPVVLRKAYSVPLAVLKKTPGFTLAPKPAISMRLVVALGVAKVRPERVESFDAVDMVLRKSSLAAARLKVPLKTSDRLLPVALLRMMLAASLAVARVRFP